MSRKDHERNRPMSGRDKSELSRRAAEEQDDDGEPVDDMRHAKPATDMMADGNSSDDVVDEPAKRSKSRGSSRDAGSGYHLPH